MSKADRFFEIIQIMRSADKPVLARNLAHALEVSERTIYRDIATLQSMRTPIEGAPGIGYILRKGYDLPPVNLDIEEAEAITIGLSMIARTGDTGLIKAAKRAARKLHDVAPQSNHLISSSWGSPPPDTIDMSHLREAIRLAQALSLTYQDVNDQRTSREIWPLALIYFAETTLLVAWCHLRQDYRHFRLDRVHSLTPTGKTFENRSEALLQTWQDTLKDATVNTA